MAKRIYFIGIGGISMSSLAVFYAVKGNVVEGSDISQCENLKELTTFGIKYNIGHYEKNIKKFNPNIVVINCAINEENPELKWAIKKNKKIISRAEALGKLFKDFKNVIAISGTHGKTTTTAILSEIFIKANTKPTIHVGGILKSCGSNFLIGDRKYFITEACEYKKSFLTLHPFVNCVLNVDSDHPDCYKNFDEISSAFKEFLGQTKKGGVNILFGDDPVLKNIEGIKFGFEKNNDFYPQNIVDKKGFFEFDAVKREKKLLRLSLPLAGRHNIANALCVLAAGEFLGLDLESLKEGIESFEGVNRRCSVIKGDFDVIVDYAHHPKEIACFLSTVKEMGYNNLILVFQPHTYTRTKLLFDDFVNVLDGDEIHIIPTFAAREEVLKGFESSDLAAAAKEKGKNVFYDENLAKLCDCLKKKCKKNDAVLLVGAGDVENLKQYLV